MRCPRKPKSACWQKDRAQKDLRQKNFRQKNGNEILCRPASDAFGNESIAFLIFLSKIFLSKIFSLFLRLMPIIIRTPIRRLSQAEFGELAYAVMRCVFQIHSELGRFFDEKIYKRELAHRYPGVQLEFPIEVIHATFK